MATVIEHPAYFTSFPREFYHSEELFEREMERVFHRQWLYFGQLSQIPDAGDYLAVEVIGGENVIAVRGADGEVRAFLNVCRHRGALLCPRGSGHVQRSRIVCPYHQWTYSPDGRLVHGPTIRDGHTIDYEDWGLHPVQVEVLHGIIFVCLGTEPLESLAALVGDEPGFARFHPERTKIAHTKVYEIEANWKIAMENFAECYHCAVGHPELTKVINVFGYYGDDRATLVGAAETADPVWEYGIDASVLPPGVATRSIDGQFVCRKLLGEFGESGGDAGFQRGIFIRPARTLVGFHADYGYTLWLRPLSVDRSELVSNWLVHEDAEEGVDYDLDSLCELLDVTYNQDVRLCSLAQQGTRSRRYVPGPLDAEQEPLLRDTLLAYFNLMNETAD